MSQLSPRQIRDLVSQIDTTAGPSACWPWIGATRAFGYGRFGGSGQGAHRAAYELMKGPIPDGLVLDHLCRNPPCVNPLHLEPVTQRENTLRSPLAVATQNAAKTHCVNGHEFNATNTYIAMTPKGVRRDCRVCMRERSARCRQRKLAAT